MALRRRAFEGAPLGTGGGRGGERSGNGHGAVGENTRSNTGPDYTEVVKHVALRNLKLGDIKASSR